MRRLVVERRGRDGWLPLGVVLPGDVPGSMSDTAGGREMLMFLCDEAVALVGRSVLGYDALVPGSGGRDRAMNTAGLEILALLGTPGDYYEKWVRLDGGTDALVRWTWRP